MKLFWIRFQIAILKPLVKFEELWNAYKELRLRMFVRNQIITESGYDFNVIKALSTH